MRPYKKQNEVCNECEQAFIDEMNRLVGAVEGYSQDQHKKKEQEINSAFSKQEQESVRHR